MAQMENGEILLLFFHPIRVLSTELFSCQHLKDKVGMHTQAQNTGRGVF